MAQATSPAAGLLRRQLKEIQTSSSITGISCGLKGDNIFEWEVMLMISDDCKYYGGGNFMCNLSFPPNYPHAPPTLTFLSPIPFHPNIYAPSSPTPGLLCISILHPPEEDIYGYEAASERWNPVQTPETILLSVISLFYGPNDESPANVEAARLWREEERLRKEGEGSGGKKGRGGEFARECRRIVRVSQGDE